MRKSYSVSYDLVWPAVVGMVAAVTVIPINVAILLIWLLLLVFRYVRVRAGSVVIAQCVVLILVLGAAALAPVKTTEIFLNRAVILGTKQMSLQQLNDYAGAPENRERLPIHIFFLFAE